MQTAVGVVLIGAGMAGLIYSYGIYPAILAVIASRVKRPAPPAYESGHEPTVSIIIAAHNEEAAIAAKLASTAGLAYPDDRLEIVVVSDGSTDETAERVARFAETDRRVRLVEMRENRGKTAAQNAAVPLCKGEILVFSDATTEYDRDAVRHLVANYSDPSVGAVSGRYTYQTSGGAPTGSISAALWDFENFLKSRQSRIRTLTGCSGCIYSMRRSLYTPLPDHACSDLVAPLMLVKGGYRVVLEDRAHARELPARDLDEEFAMRARVIAHGMHSLWLMRELLDPREHGWVAYQLISHKVCRWLLPVFAALILLGAILAKDEPVGGGLLAAQIVFYAAGLVGMHLREGWIRMATLVPAYVCAMMAAVGSGAAQLARGEPVVRWRPMRHGAERCE